MDQAQEENQHNGGDLLRINSHNIFFIILGFLFFLFNFSWMIKQNYLHLFFSFNSILSFFLFAWLFLGIIFILIFLVKLFRIVSLSIIVRLFSRRWFFYIYFTLSILFILNIFSRFFEFTNSLTSLSTDTTTANNSCTGLTNPITLNQELLTNGDFSNGLNSWTAQIWFKENIDQYHQVSVNNGIVNFTAVEGTPNSRTGIMQTLNIDVSTAKTLILNARIRSNYATLGGTGQQGREAPIAIGIVYYDENCVLHNALPEDPSLTTNRMFWRGFNFQPPSSYDISLDLIQVNQGEWYNFNYDLSQLHPKVIVAIGFEGAGWAPRNGDITAVSLIAK